MRDLAETYHSGKRLWHERARDHEAHLDHGALTHIDACLRFLPPDRRRVAVQAGGHVGVWPARLGTLFKEVYTFEPDADNFRCLAVNAPGWNIYPFRACLGEDSGWCSMDLRNKSGSNRPADATGPVPIMALDSLGLGHCDLLCLDIEGYETMALRGAHYTIRNYRPIILIEETGQERTYGKETVNRETAWRLLNEHKYKKLCSVDKDGIWGYLP